MESKPKILVVDDHREIRNSVARYLARNGMEVATAETAADMDRQMDLRWPDLVVLDVMMPGEDGLSACARLRDTTNVPVLLLTALDGNTHLLKGFETGADDYMSKPFNPPELLARIQAILRRTRTPADDTRPAERPGLAGKTARFGGVSYDVDARVVERADGRTEVLTSGEASLLCVLIEHARDTLSRDELLMKSAGRVPGPFDRTIDNQVSRLRKKIEPDILRPRLITTIRNGGYSLSCDVEIVS
ncbi:response regulator [Pseudaestuariivita atlantica]|uniref:Chemotaxis protein CheY n=1 Tax=Pseudaestuariivita atlantica TaxID=1317121 RepID=A0A0L1JUF6_9RHOB|nr:response regulator [Pseudaestuariivita atlantica]KNG95396.1 chemotaxis protein CheY [Pseudaestuariivita atlantica]